MRFPVALFRPIAEQLPGVIEAFEARYLRRASKKARGRVGRTARITGHSRRRISDKIAQCKIDEALFKNE
jgi:DNA-binding NtrC family response regulator